MNFDKSTKNKLLNILTILNNCKIENLTFECYKVSTGEIKFIDLSGKEVIFNISELHDSIEEESKVQNGGKHNSNYSETSDALYSNNHNNFSETSELIYSQNGGKNISKYSETSDAFINNNFSETSELSNVQSGGKRNKYNDISSDINNTDNSFLSMQKILNKYRNNNIDSLSENNSEFSFIGQEGGYYKSNAEINDNFSETSDINQYGGNFETTDTLKSISDLKIRRKINKSSVDLNIFKKNNQSGGNLSNSNSLKQKMNEIGIQHHVNF